MSSIALYISHCTAATKTPPGRRLWVLELQPLLLIERPLLMSLPHRTLHEIDVLTLDRTLRALACFSSSSAAAAAACSQPQVVGALIRVLRLERQALLLLQQMAADHHQRQQQQLLDQQQLIYKNRQRHPLPVNQQQAAAGCQQHSVQGPVTGNACTHNSAPGRKHPGHAPPAQVPPLSLAALQAPIASVQHPDAWLSTWLKEQVHGASNVNQQGARPAHGLQSTHACKAMVKGSGSPGCKQHNCTKLTTADVQGQDSGTLASQHDDVCEEDSTADTTAGCNCAPDGSEGMLALWALLNASANLRGQVSICKKGLYTLINLVHHSPDPWRASVAAMVLRNVAVQENIGDIYKAELRLKHAALLRQAGIQRVYRERQQPHPQPQQLQQPAGTSVDLSLCHSEPFPQQMVAKPHNKHGPDDFTQAAAAAVSRPSCSPPLTSRLQEAADAAVLKADLSSSLCQGSIELKADVDQAAYLLRRASMVVRDAADCGKLQSNSGSRAVTSSSPPASAGLRTFSVGIHSLAERAAGLVSGRHPTPGAPGSTVRGDTACCSVSRPGQPPQGVEYHNVRTAFLEWLHSQLPDPTVAGCSAAAGLLKGKQQQPERPPPTLQRLTEGLQCEEYQAYDLCSMPPDLLT
jgi:hypothetical protein